MRYRRRYIFLGGILLAAVIATVCIRRGNFFTPRDEKLTILTIGTADSGGTMYPVGSAIAQTITEKNGQLKINVSASSGSMMNIDEVLSGEFDLALVSGDVAYAAMTNATQGEQGGTSLRAIAAVYESSSNWIVPETLDIEYVHDLRDLSIGVGPKDSTTELSAKVVFQALDMTDHNNSFDNCSLISGAQKVLGGQLQAVHAFTGTPVPIFEDMASDLPCRILRYTQDELAQLVLQNPCYYLTSIPVGSYQGQLSAVDTFAVKCLLVADASMDDQLAYTIAQTLWQERETLAAAHPSLKSMQDDAFLVSDLPIALHDGAAEFYQQELVR